MGPKLKVYDLALISVLTAILFIQEQLLAFLPNFQLTFFLLILYAKKLSFKQSVFITITYVLIDGFITSSIGLIYTPSILIGLLIIPITIHTIFKHVESSIKLAFISIIYSLIYSWLFIIPFVFMLKVDWYAYLTADILFEVILATSSFLTTLILYDPLSNVFDLWKEKMKENK